MPPAPAPAIGVLGPTAFGNGIRPLQSHALQRRFGKHARAPWAPPLQLHRAATPGTAQGALTPHAHRPHAYSHANASNKAPPRSAGAVR